MQRSLFYKGGIQSGFLPCDFVGSCVLSAVVVWVIHYDRANPAHSFKTGLLNQSLWMCLVVEVYVRDCLVGMYVAVLYAVDACLSPFLYLCLCTSPMFYWAGVYNLLLHEICIISDSRPLYYHHTAQEVTSYGLIDRF